MKNGTITEILHLLVEFAHPTNGMSTIKMPMRILITDTPIVQLERSFTLITFILIIFFPKLCPSPIPSLMSI